MPADDLRPGRAASPLRREEIAHLEVGRTTVTPRLAGALTAWLVGMLVLLPALEWAGERVMRAAGDSETTPWARLARLPAEMRARADEAGRPPTWGLSWSRLVAANRALLAGLTAFEDALEDGSPVGRLLRPPAQALLSGWLGAGNEQVYVGRDGWLFFRTDVEYVTGPGFLEPAVLRRRVASASEFQDAPHPDPRPAIIGLARDLEARGIALVLVPTPVKPTVHPERLARRAGGADVPLQNASFADWVADMRRAGVRVFDPAPALVAARLASGARQYLASDTHWRPEAMQRIARDLADYLRREVHLPQVPPPGYRLQARQARHGGDTAAMLDLPAGHGRFSPETVDLQLVTGPDGRPWAPSRDADVLLLGDSFTNIYSQPALGWGESAGFAEHLSVALGRPLDRIVQNDAGAYATRALLARDVGPVADESSAGADRLTGKRVVVWQFAARELAFGDWRVLPLAGPSGSGGPLGGHRP